MIGKNVAWFYRGKFFLAMLSICLLYPLLCQAEVSPVVSVITTPLEELNLIVRKSTIIESSLPVKRVSLADEEIADALVLTPQQIYLTGKVVGITRLTLWDETDKVITSFDLEVLPEISRLKEKLHEMFPDEEDIRVTATHKSISLSGTVSNALILSQVLSLAQAYAPGGTSQIKINNFLQVGGVQQVMLEVRVADLSRTLSRRLGVNFSYLTESGKFGASVLDNLARITPGSGPVASVLGPSQNVNLIFRFMSDGTSWTFFIDAIKDVGLLKILAEPTLITLSGKTAHFLAGGEFPVPVPQSGAIGLSSNITIQYKPFGVGLNFTPTVLSNGKISMEISPEVSELDFANAVSFQGFIIPGITTRRVSTVVELADGQSFAIAGLLNDTFVENVRRYPFIGDIPIIGNLFKTSSFEKQERELVVIVTPHLVRPLDKAKQTLPTDQFVEPNDIEFYLFGRLEGFKSPSSSASNSPDQKNKGGLEGKFGHMAP
ncbi:MAG: type II and III secretion system protein family protein [Planctomycetota bacterium]|jgi:pilus assembly protein CpaC